MTVEEIFELLKRTSLPTVLVEGKDDIIFYRAVEHELRQFDVDMLPAGNKEAVLTLKRKIEESPVSAPIVFVVDNDLWVHGLPIDVDQQSSLVTTSGYSIENDLFMDGDLQTLLTPEEITDFGSELHKFVHWYALAIDRYLNGREAPFRTHPGKVLDDDDFFTSETSLNEGEVYPERLRKEIESNYARILRGKSLFALLLRQLSAKKREIKFSGKQLMAFGASRKGPHFQRIKDSVRAALERTDEQPSATTSGGA
ncbi:DUF4435 domain-containing protein [Burkholderia gladioli]|uniref:DUF4435 domain-containing protein n=1 Tax=Burkholderia gladioli TaxID=28095 RepID=UPI001ABB4C8F|nr:DUF4435 domain-containing protein [Burkholderia gladioli]MDN7725030.1 DUF4435 domain-containing protein [Burkholderia gladioli]